MFRKIAWVFLEKGLITIIQFLSIIILGRLLTPEDYGTYGIMMIFIMLSDTLVDSGFGGALVNKKNVNQQDLNTLFFTNATFSLILYLVIFISAPFLEGLYRIENLALYFRVLGVVIISHAFSIVQNALILRDLRFKFSTAINLISAILSTVLAIFIAYLGFGIWALIAQVLLNSLILTAILWCQSKIKISTNLSKESFKEFWKFGSNLLGANIFQIIVNNIANNIIPRIGTLLQSGLYFQSTKLNSVPVNILSMTIDKSLFPILSRETDSNSLLNKARSVNRYFVSFVTPIFPLVSISAYPIIKLILGDKWLEATEFLSIMMCGGIALILQALYRNILKSLGYTKDILIVEIIKSSITIAIILTAMHWGVRFLVWGVMISYFVGALIWTICLNVKTNYNYHQQFKDVYKSFIAICIVSVVIVLMKINTNSYWSLLVLPLGYLAYIIVSILLGNIEIITSLKRLISLIDKHD